ncbi:type II secretion system F family protein [Caldisericum sp. AR60]|uniref:type II secretion system F family protein n=1 Tax=Caldisericum sp. AR60 TaxID=3397852 RepID=UPI0039FD9B03
MPQFEYKVITASGGALIGRLEGNSVQDVAETLRSKGYRIIYIKELRSLSLGGKRTEGGFLSPFQGVSVRDLSIFTNQFGTMLNAGLSISRALAVLEKQTSNPKLVQIIKDLSEEVKKGNQLSMALKKFPQVFSPLYISMVQAGETSGNLGQALITMSTFLQRDYETRNKIRGAMTYPVAVLGFAILIVVGLFIFVIPTFEGFLTELGAPLPAITKMIFAFANFLIHYIWVIVAIIVIAIIAFRRWVKTPEGRRTVDALKLKLPLISELTLKSSMARFSDTLATLFSAGIPIIDCLQTVRGVIDNVIIAEKIDGIIDAIKKGEALSSALEKSGMFTPMVYDMTAIGEESGSLDKMLRKVAEFYNEEVNYLINNISALINPIMMVGVGGLIGGTLIGLYLPVFQMASYIK